jgi:dolichyl-diphosphooligosaccharide--protein glycosyltransferase
MKKFFTWFDDMSWYPLGRPIGTTIYPGMQFTAVWIKRYIVGDKMSLNDVCCYIPAWFGAIASILVGLITYECCLECNSSTTLVQVVSDLFHKDNVVVDEKREDRIQRQMKSSDTERKKDKHTHQEQQLLNSTKKSSVPDDCSQCENNNYDPSIESAIFAMGIMGMVPAHLMRSMGGGYDNESVAVTAMLLTFYFWVRSLRNGDEKSYLYGVAAGLAFFYMASCWGGYVFVSNLIALHAALLLFMGRFTNKIYLSYTLFYVVGTVAAVQIPIVGYAPITTLEQLPSRIIIVLYQFVRFGEYVIKRRSMSRSVASLFRFRLSTVGILLIFAGAAVFGQLGYLVPVSTRITGLFLKLSKTGNPLVDSVAEHQPADGAMYFRNLQYLCILAPIGFILTTMNFGDSPSFLLTYAVIAWYFSNKMVRLIILVGPVASCLGGLALGRLVSWSFCHLCEEEIVEDESENDYKQKDKKLLTTKNQEPRKKKRSKKLPKSSFDEDKKEEPIWKTIAATAVIVILILFVSSFQTFCLNSCRHLSNPVIVQLARTRDGATVKVDDYREAYWWLRDNTSEDARILSWWDYGYQITSISNRTTLCDGNTWNYEHIALVGRVLTAKEDEAYQIARLLADYILIWTGEEGDDLGKSPHIAKIANSVYPNICPNDPTCANYDLTKSLLYKLHFHKIHHRVQVQSDFFQEVYKSKYGKVRIFKIMNVDQESKAWVTKNKKCDKPGGWICPGSYPPKLIPYTSRDSESRNFQTPVQIFIEKDSQKDDSERVLKEFFVDNVAENTSHASSTKHDNMRAQKYEWQDTEYTVRMWNIIHSGKPDDLEQALKDYPAMAFMRSSDGRSAMHWAFENRREEMVRILKRYGVGYDDVDKYGLTPVDLLDTMLHY